MKTKALPINRIVFIVVTIYLAVNIGIQITFLQGATYSQNIRTRPRRMTRSAGCVLGKDRVARGPACPSSL